MNDLMDEGIPEQHGMPVLGNPLLGYELEQRENLPDDPYTVQDAIKELKSDGNANPTDD